MKTTLHLLTGTAFTRDLTLEVENCDILTALDDYVSEHGIGALGVPYFTACELDSYELESYTPINGGEYWIEGVSHIN